MIALLAVPGAALEVWLFAELWIVAKLSDDFHLFTRHFDAVRERRDPAECQRAVEGSGVVISCLAHQADVLVQV